MNLSQCSIKYVEVHLGIYSIFNEEENQVKNINVVPPKCDQILYMFLNGASFQEQMVLE